LIDELLSYQPEGEDTNNIYTARLLNPKANLCLRRGDLETAERMTRKALKIWEEHHTQDGSQFKITLATLANICKLKKDYEEAEQLFLRIIETHERLKQETTLHMAVYYVNLADVYELQGKWDKAEPFYRKALRFYEEKAPNHEHYAKALGFLAVVLEHLGRQEEADATRAKGEALKTRLRENSASNNG